MNYSKIPMGPEPATEPDDQPVQIKRVVVNAVSPCPAGLANRDFIGVANSTIN